MTEKKWTEGDIQPFLKDLDQMGISLTEDQIGKFLSYYEMLIQQNRVMNLTAITEYGDVMKKHFVDSLSLIRIRDLLDVSDPGAPLRVIDVGTGAGFPGLPLKIAFPHLQVTLLDSLQKRVGFLQQVIVALVLQGVWAIHGRAEDLAAPAGKGGKGRVDSAACTGKGGKGRENSATPAGKDREGRADLAALAGKGETGRKNPLEDLPEGQMRESFDLCVSRAVANLATLSEYCLPFVKVGGIFVSYKSEKIARELEEAERAVSLLGGRLLACREFTLPDSDIFRSLAVIQKTAPTPGKYPRKAGLPGKEPLR